VIADLKPYGDYKDSGLPWLGGVPAHWQVLRNGNLFGQRNETGRAELPILEVSLKTGVRVRAFGDGGRKQVMSDLGKYKRVAQGDLAYNTMRMWQGALGVCPVDGLVSPAYVVARPFPEVNPRYFAALFRTAGYMAEIDSASRGIVKDRNRLYWEQFKQMSSLCPPPEEQAAIVRLLDWTNGRLERAIRAKRKVIALLNEQKQAIIHRAVTRGLDPSVPLKPSGVPWLGDIPQHWDVASIGTTVSLLQTGPFGSQLHAHEYVRSGLPVINPSHMKDGRITPSVDISISQEKAAGLSRHMLRDGDIVIARRGDLGRCALVTETETGWICGTGSILLRCKPSTINAAFFQIVFSSRGIAEMLGLSSIGATMANLNERTVARQRMPLPPLDEQNCIVSFVEDEGQKTRAAISRFEREITLLREYRTRLIADVVTGQLDVREAAARLPDDVPLDAPEADPDLIDDPETADEEAIS
jgi:type I restriction enzyme S subunit